MPGKKPIIQDVAIIGDATFGNPIGEAPRRGEPIPISLMMPSERADMVSRLESSIHQLMDDADKVYQTNCYKPGTNEVNPDYITRLSTNEFFFYTKEPLTLEEFEKIQNKIADKAKTLSSGVSLIFGSFAVKTEDNKVMNVTPHITCGKAPDFHFIVKNHTSPIDVRYKIPSDSTNTTETLAALDKSTSTLLPMPKIMIDGTFKELSFNNLVTCKTLGGTEFLAAIDICLDHARGVARINYEELKKRNPAIKSLPIFHVVVSNCICINPANCLGSDIMHVDPEFSPTQCKKGALQQQTSSNQIFKFGKDLFSTYVLDVVRFNLKNNYAYIQDSPLNGRSHGVYEASINNIKLKNTASVVPSETMTAAKNTDVIAFQEFKIKYEQYKGDYLKTKILEDFKKQIEKTSSTEELVALKKTLTGSYAYDVLKKGQGWFTQVTGIKTSSLIALDDMFKQQEKYLKDEQDDKILKK